MLIQIKNIPFSRGLNLQKLSKSYNDNNDKSSQLSCLFFSSFTWKRASDANHQPTLASNSARNNKTASHSPKP